jgi:hypothetical protein
MSAKNSEIMVSRRTAGGVLTPLSLPLTQKCAREVVRIELKMAV